MLTVDIYTDGACSGNPGPGGYGVVMLYNGIRKELSKGYKLTTNNRMELTAVIVGLSALKKTCRVNLYSDSKYVVDSVLKEWVFKWEKQNWKRKTEDVPNKDLWIKLLKLIRQHDVMFIWVKGHASNVENNRCDELARAAINSDQLETDIFK